MNGLFGTRKAFAPSGLYPTSLLKTIGRCPMLMLLPLQGEYHAPLQNYFSSWLEIYEVKN
ncbi:hypothetical protein DFO77_10191 [Marinilabilia salmonicolor]|uniref:Uncharacterized protein n=2 Tax=Marinilabilia salmonicolor TaxID=989 RepID=A0A368VE32_9BACT|nr:hypothetical protein DFO77_10191 [Marinilabilia salmonicolor]